MEIGSDLDIHPIRYYSTLMLKVLKKARKLILKGWTRQTFARDKSGKAVSARSRKACKYCATGAIIRAGGSDEAAYLVQNELTKFDSLALFNDRQTTKWPVVHAFDRAIAKASK